MLKPETYAVFERSFEAMLVDLLANGAPAPHIGEGQIAVALDLDTLASHLTQTVVAIGHCLRQIAADL